MRRDPRALIAAAVLLYLMLIIWATTWRQGPLSTNPDKFPPVATLTARAR